jgi:hypothetical protein
VPSIDKCSRRSPPPCSRLSHRRTGFQCSFASRMLAHIEARPTTDPQVLHPRASWPHTACQFLQPKRPATTTAETAGPRALRGWCDPSTLRCLGGWQRPLRDEPTETSRARGVPRLCQAHSLRLDRSKRRLSPNPIRSSTFCRKLAWMHGWRCHPPGVSDKQIQCTSSPAANHASVTRQGRFRHPSAKKDTICCTQGAFHQQISLIEACSAPSSTLSPV